MSEGTNPAPPSGEDEAVPLRDVERNGLVVRAQALRETARELRADSREIVARSVEDRIAREDQRTRR